MAVFSSNIPKTLNYLVCDTANKLANTWVFCMDKISKHRDLQEENSKKKKTKDPE